MLCLLPLQVILTGVRAETLYATPAPESSPVATDDRFPGMTGLFPDDFPDASLGELAVVAEGPTSPLLDPARVVIVHNNSPSEIWVDEIVASKQDLTGQVVEFSVDYYLTQHTLKPGEYSVGIVWLTAAPEDDDEVTYNVLTGTPRVSFDLAQTPLDIHDLKRDRGTFSGSAFNQTDHFVTLIAVFVVCLSETGEPLSVQSVYVQSKGMQPTDSVPFITEDTGADLANDCPRYLAGTLADYWGE